MFQGEDNRYETTMFVDATPNSSLAKQFQKELDDVAVPIKVIDKAETSVKRILSRSNPFKTSSCNNAKCQTCSRSENVNCKTRECVYVLECECGDKYIGETSRSINERITEHTSGLAGQAKENVLWRHMRDNHNGQQQ